jgi:purine-binding chemotaxis protein CheW
MSTQLASQYLTFAVNNQDFGIEILRVQEIKNFSRVTPIPNMPACVKGLMNLRGTVVPIVDLRSKFSMPFAEYDQFTVIIVVNVGGRVMGLVVDAVSDVLDINQDAIENPPNMGGADTSFIMGLAKSGDQIVTLLNIEQLLADQSASLSVAV